MIEELIKQFTECLEGLQALDQYLEDLKSAQEEPEEIEDDPIVKKIPDDEKPTLIEIISKKLPK